MANQEPHRLIRILLSIPVAGFVMLALSTPAQGADQDSFVTSVRPFLEQYCSRCHGAEKPRGEFRLQDINGEAHFEDDSRKWEKILEMLASGEMPPEGRAQPDRSARNEVVSWIRTNLADVGRGAEWDRKLLFPEYGNYVDHAQLFDGSVKAVAWSPSRLWKRSPDIFESMLMRGIGLGKGRYNSVPAALAKAKQPFTIEENAGIRDYAAILYADSATLGTMMRNAEVIVDTHLAGAMHELDVQLNGETPDEELPKDNKGKPIRPRYQKTCEEFRQICMSSEPPSDAQIDTAIGKMYELVIEREPSEEKLAKYRELIRKCIADGGNAEGLRMGLIAIAISPEAIYRSELGQGSKDEHGRQMLNAADLAYAIAYALTDQKPDPMLLKAAATGRLSTREDVAREVARIWDDDSIEKPRVPRFFREYFGYHNAPLVFKDAVRFGKDYRNVPERLVADADLLVAHLVKQDRNVLAELLTTEEYFVAHSGDNEEVEKTVESLKKFYAYFKETDWKNFPYQTPKEHAERARSFDKLFSHPNGNVVKNWMRYLTACEKHGITPIPQHNGRVYIEAYNLTENTFDYPVKQPFVLAKGKRAGILMHPAWLIAHSVNLDNDPVQRGKWIRERLLADTVPELPITVDARIPDAPEESLRERFSVTRQTECWRCHVKMNPLGMPFESFDDFGRHRLVEKLHAEKKTKPVDSTGTLVGTTDPMLDGDVTGPIDLVHRLARSERVRQSFVRHAFRYWMGRNEMLSDSSTLIAADRAYVENEGSFRSMVISLLTSDSFLYRKASEN